MALCGGDLEGERVGCTLPRVVVDFLINGTEQHFWNDLFWLTVTRMARWLEHEAASHTAATVSLLSVQSRSWGAGMEVKGSTGEMVQTVLAAEA